MPPAQRRAEAGQNLRAQQLAVPGIRSVSQLARAVPEREFELPHLRIGECRVPPGMRLFLQPFDAELLEFAHPPLDAARVIAEHLGHFIATPARAHQSHAVQPVHKARL